MKMLHIASFTGNIGDNCSHNGFYNILKLINIDITKIVNLEIRDFYNNRDLNNKRFFDLAFAEFANKFDLIVIGGGGFLDYFVEGSATGTTINISKKVLDSIKTPILLSSVGCVPTRFVPRGNSEKFLNFLEYVKSKNKIEILFRNDGSLKHLREQFGNKLCSHFEDILDNGFHFELKNNRIFKTKRKFIAINTSYDQLLMVKSLSKQSNLKKFYKELCKVINFIVQDLGLDVCLVPHIYQDLVGINLIIEELDDFIVRNGDGLSNIDIHKLIEFHKNSGKIATLSAVFPTARFGELDIDETNTVKTFMEKPQLATGRINGGFFVFNSRVFDFIEGDKTILEREPMENLVAKNELAAYKHDGFWQSMDTVRERQILEELWKSGKALWK